MSIALSADKALIVGDLNSHFEKTHDPLKIVFEALLDAMGYTQNVIGPSHHCNHTLDLVLSPGIRIENLVTVSQNKCISDHYLIMHEVVLDYNVCVYLWIIYPKRDLWNSHTFYSHCLSPILLCLTEVCKTVLGI